MANLAGQGRLGKVFSHKHVYNIAIFSLVFLVTGTNIYASTAPPQPEDPQEHHSLLMKMVMDQEDELLVEDTDYDPGAAMDVGYLDGYALDVRDLYVAEEIDEYVVGDNYVHYDDIGYSQVAINAVSNVPEESDDLISDTIPTRTRIETYTVVGGDNVGSIARKFGLTTKTVLASNGLSGYSILGIGRELKIPPVDGIIYTVKTGDTLGKIATKYKSEVDKVADLNGISPEELSVGMEIVLPGGRLPPPPPPPRVTTQYASNVTTYTAPSPDLMEDTQLLWPTGCRRISQYYGWRHTGLDIACPMRTPLYAAESGTVIFSGWNSGGYGNMVLLDHGGGLYTRYAHATQLLVSQGDTVARGDTIALLGSTGRSTGPHVHFEVMVGSIHNRVNPLNYIR